MAGTATAFTPLASALGGILIGLAAVLLLLFNGRIAGVSGILAGLLPAYGDGEWRKRLAFIAGLLAAPVLYQAVTGLEIPQTVSENNLLLSAAGLLVGFGAVLGGGCTSGHGVCGLSRLSRRSLAATAIFMGTAFATVYVSRHVLGG